MKKLKNNYFSIIEFENTHSIVWDKFNLSSNYGWLWHTSDVLKAKSEWENYKNLSFFILDNSNKNEIVAIIPLFFVKNIKFYFNYSRLESNGGPIIKEGLTIMKKKKLIRKIKDEFNRLLIKYKANKLELSRSSLPFVKRIEEELNNTPFSLYTDKNFNESTWILELFSKNINQIYNSFDNKTKNIIKKSSIESLNVKEIKLSNQTIINNYYKLHIQTYKRNKIKPHKKEYFSYIIKNMIDKHAKIYQVYKGKELLSMMIFGIYKNSAIYWTNACSLNGLKYGANYFGIWEVIKKFKKMKLSFFELGEAFESSINKKKLGLNHFKKGFGCKSYPYYKSEIIKNKYKDLLTQILYNLKNDITNKDV